MLRRLPALMQMFPQLDPWNIWDLPMNLWEVFAVMCDQWVTEQRKAAASHG